MDMEEEMIEEHLDEEYQNSGVVEDFAGFETQIVALEKKLLSINFDQDIQYKLKKTVSLLRLHVQNYQRIIILNRRRSKQRLWKKQRLLRNIFLQSLMDIQLRFVQTLPLTIDPLCIYNNSNIMEYKKGNLTASHSDGDTEKTDADLDYYRDVVSNYSNDQWLETFHMPKHVFELICLKLKTSINSVEMNFEAWIVMCIYILATGSRFKSVAVLFSVETEFARSSFFKFLAHFLQEFSEEIPKMPKNKTELEKIAKGFQKASNMTPCVAGVLSLVVLPSLCECRRYKICGAKNLKVQICIDNRLLFRKVEITTEKPTMLLKAPNEISHNWKKFSDDCVVPYFIVAPSGYPLRTWLMQKYDEPHETWEYDFNKSFGSLNIFREISLKRLFGRWQILNSSECILPEPKSVIVEACCLLHNILEENGEYFSVEWCNNFNPSRYESGLMMEAVSKSYDLESAKEKRDSIAKLIRTTKLYFMGN